MGNISIPEALTFDDVLLLPGRSDVLPAAADTSTHITRNIRLQIPLASAAMDTVTEARLAIAIAQQGGIGFIHRNMPVERQVLEVDRVKRSESGMISDPVTMSPEDRIQEALEVMRRYKISGVPVTKDGKLVGILTNRDLRFETRLDLPIGQVMTRQNLITAPVGTTLDEAERLLQQHRVEKLPVVDEQGVLRGLITVKDIQKKRRYPLAAKDAQGRLRVGAAVGATGDFLGRAQELARAKVDVIAVDTAHAQSGRVLEAVKTLRRALPTGVDLIAGNVATFEGACDLVRLDVDAVKVGVGPGSICTTRVVTGAGVPQITAIMECRRAIKDSGVPLIADGGVKWSGDITKALAAGAQAVMIGNLLAGCDESPGEFVLYQGRTFKTYRGMGSLGVMESGASDRYSQEHVTPDKLIPEGIEGRVPYKGPLEAVVLQLVGGLRSGMGYTGASNIEELHKAHFARISTAGLRESHVHDVIITKEAPNYRLE
jgi:IMP dehydrogenase